MVQTRPQLNTFAEYLAYSDQLEGFYELVDGVLVELPPESGINVRIANRLFLLLVSQGIRDPLITPGRCELQVPSLQPKDPQNRFPDLVILREEHLPLTEKRLTITLDMPPPTLVVEVVSPGQENRYRDFNRKRDQYAAIGIPEYWLIDPEAQTILVLRLQEQQYVEVGTFRNHEVIVSPGFPTLTLTPAQILAV